MPSSEACSVNDALQKFEENISAKVNDVDENHLKSELLTTESCFVGLNDNKNVNKGHVLLSSEEDCCSWENNDSVMERPYHSNTPLSPSAVHSPHENNFYKQVTYNIRARFHHLETYLKGKLSKESPSMFPKLEKWITCSSCVRVDLAGGWTDTPPICFEYGSKVVGMAIKVDGQRPIVCRVRRTKSTKFIRLTRFSSSKERQRVCVDEKRNSRLFLSTVVEDWADIFPGHTTLFDVEKDGDFVLLKACLNFALSTCFPDLPKLLIANEEEGKLTTLSLSSFLAKHIGGGLEVETECFLPQGSGLGTSSIMAGSLLSALWVLFGAYEIELSKNLRTYETCFSRLDICYGTLIIEQLMTTGGGWQDQVNALIPALKVSQTKGGRGGFEETAPFVITNIPLPLSDFGDQSLLKRFASHLILIFCGKQRLAKNLLQTVIRNWYSGDEKIYNLISENYHLASKMESLFLSMTETNFNETLEMIGGVINEYWKVKRELAGGFGEAEPEVVTDIFASLKSIIHGGLLTGAGGGGFILLLTKMSNAYKIVEEKLKFDGLTDVSQCQSVEVDFEGLKIDMESIDDGCVNGVQTERLASLTIR